MKRRPWGHVPRTCMRCGEVGPRVWLERVGLVHFYCLTAEEKRERRRAYDEGRKR